MYSNNFTFFQACCSISFLLVRQVELFEMAHYMGWLLALPDSYQTLASLFLWQLQKQRCKREVTKKLSPGLSRRPGRAKCCCRWRFCPRCRCLRWQSEDLKRRLAEKLHLEWMLKPFFLRHWRPGKNKWVFNHSRYLHTSFIFGVKFRNLPKVGANIGYPL